MDCSTIYLIDYRFFGNGVDATIHTSGECLGVEGFNLGRGRALLSWVARDVFPDLLCSP
jgi:hypothetical protein